jgi:hypothetical protein
MDSVQTLPSPQVLYDEVGEPVEVVFTYKTFESFVRWLAATVAWEDLPPFWQDAVDRIAIEDSRDEPTRPLREILSDPEAMAALESSEADVRAGRLILQCHYPSPGLFANGLLANGF